MARLKDFDFGKAIGAFDGITPTTRNGARQFLIADGWRVLNGAAPSTPYYTATPALFEIVSTNIGDDVSGVGLRRVKVWGLGASGVLLEEIVELDGTTPVSTANQYHFLTFQVYEVGASSTNQGTVTLQTVGGATAIEKINAFTGRCFSSVDFVPAGSKGYINSFFGGFQVTSLPLTGVHTAGITIFGTTIQASTNRRNRSISTPKIIHNQSDINFDLKYSDPIEVPGFTAVCVLAGEVSTDNLNISGGYGMTIVEDHVSEIWDCLYQ